MVLLSWSWGAAVVGSMLKELAVGTSSLDWRWTMIVELGNWVSALSGGESAIVMVGEPVTDSS